MKGLPEGRKIGKMQQYVAENCFQDDPAKNSSHRGVVNYKK